MIGAYTIYYAHSSLFLGFRFFSSREKVAKANNLVSYKNILIVIIFFTFNIFFLVHHGNKVSAMFAVTENSNFANEYDFTLPPIGQGSMGIVFKGCTKSDPTDCYAFKFPKGRYPVDDVFLIKSGLITDANSDPKSAFRKKVAEYQVEADSIALFASCPHIMRVFLFLIIKILF